MREGVVEGVKLNERLKRLSLGERAKGSNEGKEKKKITGSYVA